MMAAAPSETTTAKFPAKHRRNFPRSRAGCLTCRQRKKKCDEVGPECSGCVRNKLPCAWPEPPEPSVCPRTFPKVRTLNENTALVLSLPAKDTESALITQVSDNASTITWCPLQRSFITENRAALLTPHSGILLSHFVRSSPVPAATLFEGSDGVFASIFPLAYVDDLVMHAVMAVGGSHLTASEPASLEIQTATDSHYACVLRGIRAALHDLKPGDTEKVVRILLILLKMCNYEALSRISSNGGMFPHLRAARQLVLWLREQNYQPLTPASRYLAGYLVEEYTYFVVINSIVPYGFMPSRHIPFDDFLSDPGALREFDTFGTLFSGCHELFGLIPAISQFAAARAATETMTPEQAAFFDATRETIRSWTQTDRAPDTPDAWGRARSALGETYRQALFIFLATARLGRALPPPELQEELQGCISAMSEAVFQHNVIESRFATILLWPMVVAGSVLTREQNKVVLQDGLRASAYSTWNSIRAAEMLEMLWAERVADERFWGPIGVYLIMEKHGINMSMS